MWAAQVGLGPHNVRVSAMTDYFGRSWGGGPSTPQDEPPAPSQRQYDAVASVMFEGGAHEGDSGWEQVSGSEDEEGYDDAGDEDLSPVEKAFNRFFDWIKVTTMPRRPGWEPMHSHRISMLG